ncbi:hypothetical protein ABKN59_004407 [Abortiporus biennis]
MAFASDVYAEQLSFLKYGHPMWRPEPMEVDSVMLGDLGHIVDGRFRRLFSCTREHDHKLNEKGLPPDFTQLRFERGLVETRIDCIHAPDKMLHGKNIKIKYGESVEDRPYKKLDFSCSGDQGAFLILPDRVDSRSVRPNRTFIDYLKFNIDSWYEALRSEWGLDVRPESLVLVRGWFKTTAWTTAAISQKRFSYWFLPDYEKDTFRRLEGMSFRASSSQIIAYRTGPLRTILPIPRFFEEDKDNGIDPPLDESAEIFAKPSRPVEPIHDEEVMDDGGSYEEDPEWIARQVELLRNPPILENTIRDQTIFLNYYKIRRRAFLPEKVVAHAEPHDPSPDRDDTAEVAEDRTESDTWVPLDELLLYILRNSEAKLAIACDEDVFFVCADHEWPDNFREFFERVSPRIYVDDDNVATVYRDEYIVTQSSKSPHSTTEDMEDHMASCQADTSSNQSTLSSLPPIGSSLHKTPLASDSSSISHPTSRTFNSLTQTKCSSNDHSDMFSCTNNRCYKDHGLTEL